MQQKAQKTTDYTIEREFLGEITATELLEQIIGSHLFSSSNQETAILQEDRKAWEFL